MLTILVEASGRWVHSLVAPCSVSTGAYARTIPDTGLTSYSGLLARPFHEQSKRSTNDAWFNKTFGDRDGTADIVKRYVSACGISRFSQLKLFRVERLAQKKGISMAQVAIAWSLSKPGWISYSVIIVDCQCDADSNIMQISLHRSLEPQV